jgi:hypothetical protein
VITALRVVDTRDILDDEMSESPGGAQAIAAIQPPRMEDQPRRHARIGEFETV